MNTQVFYHGGNIIENVNPFGDRLHRLTYIYTKDDDSAKQWIAAFGRGCMQDDLVVRKRDMVIHTPAARFAIGRRGNTFVVGPNQAKVKGITSVLGVVFGDMFEKGWRKGIHSQGHRGKKSMQRLGIHVDRELKKFADGSLSYMDIKREETTSIIKHLAKKNISLVSSSVIVSNYDNEHPQSLFSGTEIDLIGFDHLQKRFTVIEIKMTGKKISHLKEKNKIAALEKKTGFRHSELGRYAAQLACTTLMFSNTYDTQPHYPLLVICEAGSGHCESFEIDPNLLSPSRFHMIKGY